MSYLCIAFVIYVIVDLTASAYLVRRNGGIKATITDIRHNLGISKDDADYTTYEDDDDVYD